jgi:hypothetical protein
MNPDDELTELGRRLPPPAEPVDQPGEDDWAAAEQALGTSLPTDYKAFVTRYGSGSIDDFLVILNPTASREAARLVPASEASLGSIREIRTMLPDEVPFPIYPEPGGLFPWGATDNGDVGYWVTSPAGTSDAWPIAIGEVRGPGWFRHPGPLTTVLAGLLDRSIRVPFLPADWPGDQAVFRPFALSPQRERLVRLLPPPGEPFDVPARDQRSRLEAEIGRRLPSDYWWFLETYGSGWIGGDLAVFTPASASEGVRLGPEAQRIGDLLRLVAQRRPGEVPFPIHPDPGGLLAWGGTPGGVMCMWLTTDADPDGWPVILRDAARSEWFTHRGPLAWFLADLVDGVAEVSFLPGGAARRRFDPASP